MGFAREFACLSGSLFCKAPNGLAMQENFDV
jgi:hypothetical protein